MTQKQRKMCIILHIIQRNVENKQHFAQGVEKQHLSQMFTFFTTTIAV